MNHYSIPKGYKAVPLDSAPESFAWKIAILGRCPEPGKFAPVMLANLPDSRGYLGCVLDHGNMVREWIQIWIQDSDAIQDLDAGLLDQVTNENLDQKWKRYWLGVKRLSPSQFIFDVPSEESRVLYIDSQQLKTVHPQNGEGDEWRVCRDEEALARAGLPKHSQSRWRYLKARQNKGNEIFLATDPTAPRNDLVQSCSPELGFKPEYVPVNPKGGCMAARIHSAVDFSDYADLLGGMKVADIGARKNDCEAQILFSCMTQSDFDGRRHGLLFGNDNPAEIFYLRLRLFLQAAKSLQSYLRAHQSPLLNLDPASFAVNLHITDELPWAWTTTCELVRPGRAVAFTIPNTAQVRFIAAGNSGIPAYCPAILSRTSDRGATIRPLRINVENEKVSLEGTVWLPFPVPVNASDVLRFRLTQAGINGDFFAAITVDKPGALEELQFRTWPRDATSEQIAQLKRFEGGKLERSWCEFIPMLSSPYDFYSLAVLGARALLVNNANPISTVLDALERLGRAASKELSASASHSKIVETVGKLLANGEVAALGPAQIFGQLPKPESKTEFLPSPLWAETIAILLRLMTGLGNVSICSDYGAAPAGGLHLPLEAPLAALENLCARARSLVVSDWQANKELRAVLGEIKGAL